MISASEKWSMDVSHQERVGGRGREGWEGLTRW